MVVENVVLTVDVGPTPIAVDPSVVVMSPAWLVVDLLVVAEDTDVIVSTIAVVCLALEFVEVAPCVLAPVVLVVVEVGPTPAVVAGRAVVGCPEVILYLSILS